MKKRLLLLSVMAALASLGVSQALTIGSDVPELKVSKWLKGDKFEKFDASKIYVVEFWATWCGPCRTSIPHLTELAKKYKDKVNFTGVSIWEDQTDAKFMDKVEAFVAEMGDKMVYNVAAEGTEKAMASTWMVPAGEQGIPSAFIIKDNKIQWIGHPMETDKVLSQVVAGGYDLTRAKEARATEMAAQEKQMAEQAKMASLMKPVQQAAMAQNWTKAVTELDKIIAANPEMSNLQNVKFDLMVRADDPMLMDHIRKMSNSTFKDDPMMLNTMAWTIVDDQVKLKKRDFKLAVQVAEKSVKLEPESWMAMDTLALAYFKDKQVTKAIEVQTKAVDLMNKDITADPATKKELNDRLAMFKKAKAG